MVGTVQDRAAEAARCFEVAQRGEAGGSFVRVKDGSPEWVTELVRNAHGDLLPDDWRYRAISQALEAIAEADDPEDVAGEFADDMVDVYTGDRLAWLGSHLSRIGYCDEAAVEFGPASGIVEAIGQGQYLEASEVYQAVLAALEV